MATISERIRSVLAEAAESINQMATNFQNVGVAMEAVAEGIERVDTSMGRGQKRVEIVSTLENLAKVATAEVGTASFQAQTAQTAQAQEAMNITLKNTFPEGMNLVIKDVGTLKTYIDARIDAKKVGRAGQ